MEGEVASLEAERRLLQDQMERLLIGSAHTGVITTPSLKEQIGQCVNNRQRQSPAQDRDDGLRQDRLRYATRHRDSRARGGRRAARRGRVVLIG